MHFTDLKKKRMEAGVLALDVCKRTAMPPSRYSLIENGWLEPGPRLLARILAAIEDAREAGARHKSVVGFQEVLK